MSIELTNTIKNIHELANTIIVGDTIDTLKKLPSNCFSLLTRK